MKRTSVLVFVAVALALCMVANSAQAGIIYSADFNAPDYSDGPLINQNGWTLQSAGANPLQVSNTATDGKVAQPFLDCPKKPSGF